MRNMKRRRDRFFCSYSGFFPYILSFNPLVRTLLLQRQMDTWRINECIF